MTNIRQPTPEQLAKWEVQSARAAHELKRYAGPVDPVKIGFAFDDAFVPILITRAEINQSSEPVLRKMIHDRVLASVRDGKCHNAIHEYADELAKTAIDGGKLIALGWAGYLKAVMPDGASALQQRETQMAFYAGAQHLFGTIVRILDPGAEPTDQDMVRMKSINDELLAWGAQFDEEIKRRKH